MTTIIFFMSVLDVRIPRILLRSVWKTTCKVQNTYDGEPLTSYLTNETSFQESWIKRFALITFMTTYYFFEIVIVTRKVYVLVVNEEKQKMKQRSLFGGIVKHNTKFYCIYKNPDGDFESVAELFRYHIPKGGTISLQYSNILRHCKITVNFFCLSLVQRLYQVKT